MMKLPRSHATFSLDIYLDPFFLLPPVSHDNEGTRLYVQSLSFFCSCSLLSLVLLLHPLHRGLPCSCLPSRRSLPDSHAPNSISRRKAGHEGRGRGRGSTTQWHSVTPSLRRRRCGRGTPPEGRKGRVVLFRLGRLRFCFVTHARGVRMGNGSLGTCLLLHWRYGLCPPPAPRMRASKRCSGVRGGKTGCPPLPCQRGHKGT
mmetsp:Transcript_46487/g.91757  ORF Transcript_46487/g.91757 Transcript_46487/m.91757 type:complete len:202 (+) Transcript_46487:264-869(+)